MNRGTNEPRTMISLLFLFLTTIILSNNATAINDLTTNSELGKKILNQARRLDNDDDGDTTWLKNFSLKFQGCNNIKQWNGDVDNADDIKVLTSRIARFRLCPSQTCSSRKSKGCSKGYGDYVVDIDTYVSAYVEAQRRQDEYECQLYMYKHCACQNDDDKDEQDLCEYKCYLKARKYDCIDQNPYYDDDANSQGLYRNDLRDFEKYFQECSEFEIDNRYRRLGGDEGQDNDDGDTVYYIGSYCANQGGKIYLGMFTDDTCTNFADKNAGRSTFKEMTGHQLPFSDYSMVRSECISCLETKNINDGGYYGDDDGGGDDIRINDECQDVYQAAGKCETEMTHNGPSFLNENACYFIGGIKIMRNDGFIDTNFTRPNKVISFFIFLFAVSFVLLGAFIYYLRMKLGMKINLE